MESAMGSAWQLENTWLWAGRLVGLFRLWQARAHDRRYLSRMDERLIRDIGAHRADVEREAAKPCWRA